MKPKPIVLVPVRYFVPAYKAGGPVRTLKAMTESLSASYAFKVVALDRDLGEQSPFPSARSGEWTTVGAASVFYLSPGPGLPLRLLRLLRRTEYDILYLNSFLDVFFTLVPLLARRLGLLPDKPVVLAPRGELSPGALAQKRFKKLVFLRLARLLGLYRNVVLHASTELEEREIRHALAAHHGSAGAGPATGCAAPGPGAGDLQMRVARDLACAQSPAGRPRGVKCPGKLAAVFISRIAPKKNLDRGIELLGKVQGTVSLDIYGPIDDPGYWQKCRQVIEQTRQSVAVQYKGPLAHERVTETLAGYDAFLFPTLGENFGHVILESLLAGCPVVTSDRTPWQDLALQQAGWDLPLEAPERFIEVLQQLADMTEESHRAWREGAKALGTAALRDEQVLVDNRQLFAGLAEAG